MLVTPKPPVINETVEPELEPVGTMPLPLPNGTVINVTVYKVNETITIGNVTIVVFGYVSRTNINLDIYVYGVPPGNYTVNITELEANQVINRVRRGVTRIPTLPGTREQQIPTANTREYNDYDRDTAAELNGNNTC